MTRARRLLTGILAALMAEASPDPASAEERMAPRFPTARPESWIGPPQSYGALRGHVVLLFVWTFG